VTHGSLEETGRELIERLREAVRIRSSPKSARSLSLRGVDSSAVVALMRGSPRSGEHCTIAFGEREYDERPTPRRWPSAIARIIRSNA